MLDQIEALYVATISGNALVLKVAAAAFPLAGLIFLLRHLRQVKQDVQRRVLADPGSFASTQMDASARVRAHASRMMESMARAVGADDLERKEAKALRGKLIQAGYYDRSAIGLFFGLRMCLAGAGAVAALAGTWALNWPDRMEHGAAAIALVGLVGYFAPALALNRRIEACRREHQEGFPDFMDLMVVCAQAGLSMEAAIQKIARELHPSYPSLARNLEFTSIEIRTGKTLSQAIDSLGRRLGLAEAQSFATLLMQSEELGSSLTQSLRAYSDDMRNKRLMRAEEKAFSLPAKLVVPLTLFVFPTLLIVLLLPVVISFSQANL